jgi:hypothetical protein
VPLSAGINTVPLMIVAIAESVRGQGGKKVC